MSRDTGSRRLYPVAVEPSASALLASASQAGSSKITSHHDPNEASSREALPRYVALNFNFKPDSAHDCKRGALFQPGSSRNVNADWQLELESTEAESEAGPSSAKKPAHVFTGPQTAVKVYDLVLVWDEEAEVYRLDRIASAFSLKYERSKTVLSVQSQDVWTDDSARAKKRAIAGGSLSRPAAVDTRDAGRRLAEASMSIPSKPAGELKLKSKASTVMAPVRRSSRRSLAVEMEEFEDRSESPADSSSTASAARSKRNSVSKEGDVRSREDSKRVKMQESGKERGSRDEPAGGLRRSRRRSSQAQADETTQSTQRSDAPTVAPKPDTLENAEGDDDDLALELERELERELEIEMQDVNESDDLSPSSTSPIRTTTKAASNRSLSPISRLQRGERAMKISTPKAHTPDLDETSAFPSSSLSKSFHRSTSPLTRSNAGDAGEMSTSASIGLGLQQTGVVITPTASPRLDIASPIESQVRKAYGLGGPRQEEEELEDSD
ncbi:hypothetical protein [Sporisorium scitamineum]|uniref:Transcription elongation factor Eaf N-terminal domain-containing protein n=1 Tax=Sporisorium scitamineum TaxID=49012 RepID=A0A0F7SDG5_9BASI|nr:hypothetical protein [Sporisorium scitamineum]